MNKRDVHLFWPAIPSKEEILPKLEKILWPENGERPFVGEGQLVDEFEKKCSEKFGFDYALFTNSGTSGLYLSLLGANVNKGDEVITTPLTCTATNLPIIERQAKPVFADVQYETGNIKPKDIENKITKKTKAIMVVHWGGYPCDMDDINNISERYNIPIISDCAHALGATYHGKPISDFADFNMFSLQSIKQMTTIDGGLLTVPFKRSRRDLVNLSQDLQVRKKLRNIFGETLTKYFENDLSATKLPKDYFTKEIFLKLKEQPSLGGEIVDKITRNYDDFSVFWKEWQGAESLKRMRWFGIGRDERAPELGKGYFAYPTTEPGGKFHATNIDALIGIAALDNIYNWQEKRNNVVKMYNEGLKNAKGVTLFEQNNDRTSGNWLYNMHVERRFDFVEKMKENGIECSIVHERNDLLPIFRKYKNGELKSLNKINEDRICIPLHHKLTDEDVGYVIDCIKKGW